MSKLAGFHILRPALVSSGLIRFPSFWADSFADEPGAARRLQRRDQGHLNVLQVPYHAYNGTYCNYA
ncbi:hypothetical protein E4U43_007521 [Claviceps pusilla]|uniref:Uncharacterized protein n=1 Tax=Claviceps pusilla TaxID=123648 RepID=A0A9P7NDF0_9HYPO|nr:hypothetical protein E4U43_007521 [Claviceps pusilla]